MPKVELVFYADCPNVADARRQLQRALADTDLPSLWDEWDRDDPASPVHARQYGSPTILIDGKDVAGTSPSDQASCCRIYGDGNGRFQGVPTVAMITLALHGSGPPGKHSNGWKRSFTLLPAIGAVLLPRVT
jgi:hypothetical protein